VLSVWGRGQALDLLGGVLQRTGKEKSSFRRPEERSVADSLGQTLKTHDTPATRKMKLTLSSLGRRGEIPGRLRGE